MVNKTSIQAVQASRRPSSQLHPALKALQILAPVLAVLAAVLWFYLQRRDP